MIWHKKYVPQTKNERARNEQVMKLGCILSRLRSQKGLPVPRSTPTLHHLVQSGKREGHSYTICLASFYHLGRPIPYPSTSKAEARKTYGASITDGSKAFLASHGITEWQLWELTQEKLGLPADRPLSKRVPRRAA